MAWTTPRTWSVGEIVTADELNAHIRDNLLYLFGGGTGGADSCRVHSLSDHTLPHNTWDAIGYNAVRWDTNGNMAGSSGSTGVLIPSVGIYQFLAQARFASSTAGRRGLRLINPENDVVIAEVMEDAETGGSSPSELILTTIWKCNTVGVRFRVEGFQDSGSALNIVYLPDHSYEFTVVRIA
jgi:hypothetical protein